MAIIVQRIAVGQIQSSKTGTGETTQNLPCGDLLVALWNCAKSLALTTAELVPGLNWDGA